MKNDIWALTQPAALDGPEAAPPDAASPDALPLLAAKVMMVDDEPLMTDLIQTYLEDEGYTNFIASNDPRQALHLLKREQPGLLLLDLMMPHVSGFDVLAAVRADQELRYLPVIVLTASTGADSKLRALQLGATDFLSKPVDASELALRVRNTLAFRQYHERLINFDAATGLPNQRLFDRGVDEALARRELVGGLVALFSIQVPECRQLRESFDQAAVDRLAKAFARRLERHASESPVGGAALQGGFERTARVARLGADHFAMVLEGLPDAAAVEQAAKRLIDAVSAPVGLGAHEIAPHPWIGAAVSPADGLSAAELGKAAELAMARAQRTGALQYGFASPELNARAFERLSLGLQLRGAAQRGELRLHFQPKVDVASGCIVGAEALVRWEHPELGLLPPLRFIPLAEELGLIRDIGQWVIEQACVEATAWAQAGLGELKIAVNVARPQFVGGELVRSLRQAMFDSGLPARQLVIELTESMLMDDVQAGLATMHALKDLGVTLSIDDFGTGYSSLSYLKAFPLDELKIDRSFVMDLPGRDADVAIAGTVIGLGHSLGMCVTAEGVETSAQLDCLRQMGCDQFQGFLFSKPLPSAQFTAMLSRQVAPAPQASAVDATSAYGE